MNKYLIKVFGSAMLVTSILCSNLISANAMSMSGDEMTDTNNASDVTANTNVIDSANNSISKGGELNLHGEASANFVFDNTETENAIKWLSDLNEQAKNNTRNEITNTNDQDKLKYLYDSLDAMEKTDISESFTINEDGSSSIKIPLRHYQLNINGNSVMTDDSGNYEALNVPEGEMKVDISSEGKDIGTKNISISNNSSSHNTDISINVTTSDIKNAMNNMEEDMAQAQTVFMPSFWGFTSADFANGHEPEIINNYGDTKMHYLNIQGIVSCNKGDTNLGDDCFNFPNNHSDCADSIGYGILYDLWAPFAYSEYYMSNWCVIESMQSAGLGDASGSNRYCGKLNSDGHYNCSYFYGMSGEERLHINDGSNRVVYK